MTLQLPLPTCPKIFPFALSTANANAPSGWYYQAGPACRRCKTYLWRGQRGEDHVHLPVLATWLIRPELSGKRGFHGILPS